MAQMATVGGSMDEDVSEQLKRIVMDLKLTNEMLRNVALVVVYGVDRNYCSFIRCLESR